MSGDWWNEHLNSSPGNEYGELTSYYGEAKKRNVTKYAAIIVPILLLIATGALNRNKITAIVDELTSDENTGLLLDENGSEEVKSKEKQVLSNSITITPTPEVTPTPTPTTNINIPVVATQEIIGQVPEITERVEIQSGFENSYTYFIIDTLINGVPFAGGTTIGGESVGIDSNNPESVSDMFLFKSDSGFYDNVRNKDNLTRTDIWENGEPLDYFRLQSLDFSDELNKFRSTAINPPDSPEMTLNMLTEYFTHLYGSSSDGQMEVRLREYWKNNLFPQLELDRISDTYFVDYISFYSQFPELRAEITAENGQTITVSNSSLSDETLSDSDKLKALSALREKLPVNERVTLDKSEGSILAAILLTTDLRINNGPLYDYALSGELPSTPTPTPLPEVINDPLPTSTPVPTLENQEIQPASIPSPVTHEQDGLDNYTPEFALPFASKDDPYWNVNPDFAYGIDIRNQIALPQGLEKFLFPVPGGRITQRLGEEANQKNGEHTGVDIGANLGSSVIAPAKMFILQSDGFGAYHGLDKNGEPWHMGNHEVIGYFGDYTYTDENGNLITAGLFGRFGHMTQSPLLNERINQELGHSPRPNEVIGMWVEPGFEIGKIGDEGNSTGPHLHLEYISVPKVINGILQDIPNPHLDPNATNLPQNERPKAAGVRYVRGSDGTWYLQAGDVYTMLNKEKDGSTAPFSSLHQWAFPKEAEFIPLEAFSQTPNSTSSIFPDTYFSKNGSMVSSRIKQFESSIVSQERGDDWQTAVVTVANPNNTIRLNHLIDEGETNSGRISLWLNGASIPLGGYDKSKWDEIEKFIDNLRKSAGVKKKAFIKIAQKNGVLHLTQISKDQAFPGKSNSKEKPIKQENPDEGEPSPIYGAGLTHDEQFNLIDPQLRLDEIKTNRKLHRQSVSPHGQIQQKTRTREKTYNQAGPGKSFRDTRHTNLKS